MIFIKKNFRISLRKAKMNWDLKRKQPDELFIIDDI